MSKSVCSSLALKGTTRKETWQAKDVVSMWWVIKILLTLRGRIVVSRMRFCVPSPQSKSQTSLISSKVSKQDLITLWTLEG